MDVVKVHFVGQSFMLHQIRKMIGTFILIFRHSLSNIIPYLYDDHSFNTPMAPGEFLFLDWVKQTSFNFDIYIIF